MDALGGKGVSYWWDMGVPVGTHFGGPSGAQGGPRAFLLAYGISSSFSGGG